MVQKTTKRRKIVTSMTLSPEVYYELQRHYPKSVSAAVERIAVQLASNLRQERGLPPLQDNKNRCKTRNEPDGTTDTEDKERQGT